MIHRLPQRTPEWFALRAPYLTASEADAVLAKGRGSADSVTKTRLRVRLALARFGAMPRPSFVDTPAMQYGREQEEVALRAYEGLAGPVDRVGFVSDSARLIGCSPDGVCLNYDDQVLGGVEIKCPEAHTHDAYLADPNALVAAYAMQVTHTLLVTGAPYWDLVSYAPDFPPASRLVAVRMGPADRPPGGPWWGDGVVPVDVEAYRASAEAFLREVDATVVALQARERERGARQHA